MPVRHNNGTGWMVIGYHQGRTAVVEAGIPSEKATEKRAEEFQAAAGRTHVHKSARPRD